VPRLARLTGQSRVPKGPDKSSGPERPRSLCAWARPRQFPSWNWSKGNAPGLRASSDTRASADGEAGRHASPDDDLLPARRRGYAAKAVLTPVLKNQCDGTPQALQGRRLRLALAIRAGNLRAVRDVPALVPFHYRGELVPHASLASAPSLAHFWRCVALVNEW